MNIITRRSFMKSGFLGATGIAAGSLLNVPTFMREAMAAPGLNLGQNKILFVFLRGGNDGLNTVIPAGDSAYSPTIRPTISIPPPAGGLTTGCQAILDPANPGNAIDLGNGFAALHPRMKDLVPLYNNNELAIIHRVGYPNQSRSHFDSQNYWETGVPQDDLLDEGMFYRALSETGLSQSLSVPAVSFDSNMPLILRGDTPLTNISDPTRFDLLGVYATARQKHLDHLAQMHGLPAAPKKNRDLVFKAGERFLESIGQIQGVDFTENGLDSGGTKISGSPFLDDDAGMTHLFPTNSATDDKGFDSNTTYNFLESLKYSAQILSETDAVIAGTELNGFDTHNNQIANDDGHGRSLERVGWGLYALKKYLSHASVNMWDKTVVVVMTEFGRTSEENGSFGTDHAEAGVMFVAGGAPALSGGVYGCQAAGQGQACDKPNVSLAWNGGTALNNYRDSSMFSVNDRYLSRIIDYRSVLGEIVRSHLGASPEQLNNIIPGYGNPAENLLAGGLGLDGVPIFGELGLFT